MDQYWTTHNYYLSVEDELNLGIEHVGVEDGLELDHTSIFIT